MKKLLLLLATTSCCYLQANAGFYTTLYAARSYDANLASRNSITFSGGYDAFVYNNFYIALESSLPSILLIDYPIIKTDLSRICLGYKIKNDTVLFASCGISADSDNLIYKSFFIGVKYFDDNKFVYTALLQFETEVNDGPRRGFGLALTYRF